MKRRLNAARIAKVPKLKKDIARWNAQFDITVGESKASIEDMLTNGHRGYVSYEDKKLVRLLEQRFNQLQQMKKEFEENVREQEEKGRHYRWHPSEKEFRYKSLMESALKIMDDLMDEVLLG